MTSQSLNDVHLVVALLSNIIIIRRHVFFVIVVTTRVSREFLGRRIGGKDKLVENGCDEGAHEGTHPVGLCEKYNLLKYRI